MADQAAPHITHSDAAPFVGRLLLAVADEDELGLTLAFEDAARRGVAPAHLAVVVAQALVGHMDRANPGWAAQVRRGLAEGVAGA
jgi:hypothetical protein